MQSKFLAVGCVVPWAEPLVGAIATQAWANPRYGPEGLALLREGLSADEVVARLTDADADRAQRQLGIVDGQGRGATYTGADCNEWAGGRVGAGCAAQGNILVSRETVDALAETFESSAGEPLAERLLDCLDAAQAAGGDRRGKQSAAILVVGPEQGYAGLSDVFVDLRVDDHERPLEELRRLFGIHQELFGKTPRSKWIEVDDALRKEIDDRLAVLGFERLEDWAGEENLEQRVDGEDAIDPFVLERLRLRSSERREVRALSAGAVMRAAAKAAGVIARRVGGWVRLAAPFTADWVLKGAGLVLVFSVGYVAARAVTVAAFWTGFLVVEIAGLVALAVMTAVGVWWAFTAEHVHTRLRLGRAEPLAATLLVIGVAVGTFAGLTTLLYEHGQLELKGQRVTGESTIIGVAADFYIWHILESVPLLDIPQTIGWEKPYEYSDNLSGWLLLAFKGFVILPLIQVVRLILAGLPKSYEQSVLNALRQALPTGQVAEAGTSGYARALLHYEQALVRVDVMRELWTEDAPTRALARLLAGELRPDGYLLVVDAVADRARDRIEDAFAHAPLPALLAVWRSDQPVGDLAETLLPLTMELQRRAAATTKSGSES